MASASSRKRASSSLSASTASFASAASLPSMNTPVTRPPSSRIGWDRKSTNRAPSAADSAAGPSGTMRDEIASLVA